MTLMAMPRKLAKTTNINPFISENEPSLPRFISLYRIIPPWYTYLLEYFGRSPCFQICSQHHPISVTQNYFSSFPLLSYFQHAHKWLWRDSFHLRIYCDLINFMATSEFKKKCYFDGLWPIFKFEKNQPPPSIHPSIHLLRLVTSSHTSNLLYLCQFNLDLYETLNLSSCATN